MSDDSLGNLSFDQYTLETDAERFIVSIEAALVVHGFGPSSDTIKLVHKLKRSMKRNKTRRYSFSVHPVSSIASLAAAEKKKEEANPEPEVVPTEEFFAIKDSLSRCTGLAHISYKLKQTSSGYFIATFVLAGPSKDLLFGGSSALLREHLASSLLERTKDEVFSFCVSSIKVSEQGNSVGVKCQCLYKRKA